MAKKFILLSFLMLLSIITVNASYDRISITTPDNWVIIYGNNIYLYNGTLYNITPKYIVFLNKTYSNKEINDKYGYLYYIDSFYLGNKTYIICNAWDGVRIGRLDINKKTFYMYDWLFGQYHNLKSNGKGALLCVNNKEGLGAEPILIELKYNKSSKHGLTYKGDSFYGLNLELEEYLANYIYNSTDYKINRQNDIYIYPKTFDYNSKDRYWLIYFTGLYFVKGGGYKNLSGFIKYNNTFYDFEEFNNHVCSLSYDKQNNLWIVIIGKSMHDTIYKPNKTNENYLFILDNNLTVIKKIKINETPYDTYPLSNEVYLTYYKKIIVGEYLKKKIKVNKTIQKITDTGVKTYKIPYEWKWVRVGTNILDIKNLSKDDLEKIYNNTYEIDGFILGIEKINLKNDKVIKIDTDSLNPIEMGYNGKEFLLIGNDSSLCIFNEKTYKKIANLNEFGDNKTINRKFENITTNYYIYVVVMVIFIIFGYILWKKSN